MKPEKEFFSFGRYLQSIRMEKKISLEKVSEDTRIAVRNLQLIEKEDLEGLPAEVFVRGFLRAFAQAVGADGGQAIKLYDARLNLESRLSAEGRYSGRSSARLWLHMVLAVLALLSVIVLSLYGFSYFENRSRLSETSEMPADHAKPEKALIPDMQEPKAVKASAPDQVKKLVLTINAVEDLWVKVIIDDQAPNEYNLNSGEHLELEASAGYNLLIGNAGGCELKLNGEPVAISGKIGEIVSLQLP